MKPQLTPEIRSARERRIADAREILHECIRHVASASLRLAALESETFGIATAWSWPALDGSTADVELDLERVSDQVAAAVAKLNGNEPSN